MSFSKPLMSSVYSALFIRVPLGVYFILAGRLKLLDAEGFIETVRAFKILPTEVATLFGVMIPWLEVLVGVAIALGILTTLASITASFLLISYILALGVFPNHPDIFNKDLILLGCTLSFLASGSGGFSFDGLRSSS